MYQMLIDILKQQGVKTIYGSVSSPNPLSVRLHESLGFHYLGSFHNTGFKSGKWCNLMWFEKQIGEYELEPKAIIPISEIKVELL